MCTWVVGHCRGNADSKLSMIVLFPFVYSGSRHPAPWQSTARSPVGRAPPVRLMAMLGKQPRLVADKAVTAAQLQDVVEGWMKARGSRDLASLLKALQEGTTWKNAPRSSLLSQYSDLYLDFAELCSNGVMPTVKTAAALRACHVDKPCNFSALSLDQFADQYGELLMAGISKYRQLLTCADTHRRVFGKASQAEQVKIQAVLDKLPDCRPDSSSPGPAPVRASVHTAIVLHSQSSQQRSFKELGDFFLSFAERLEGGGEAARQNPPRSVSRGAFVEELGDDF